jgi:hypothetical protein
MPTLTLVSAHHLQDRGPAKSENARHFFRFSESLNKSLVIFIM